MFWVISVYFNLRNTLPKFGTFLLGHPVYIDLNVNIEEFLSRQEPNLWAFLTGIAALQEVTRLALSSYVAFSKFS